LTSAVAASGRGAALEAAITALDGVAADDATYGAAKTAFDTATVTSVTYSTNTANNSSNPDVLAAAISSESIAAAAVEGVNLALTSSVETLSGTNGNDTFQGVLDGTTAANTTVTASDVINASGGNDRLDITLQGGATATMPALQTTDLEVFAIRNVSAAATIANLGGVTGATEFVNNLSTAVVEFNGIGSADLTIVGNDVVTNAATDFEVGGTSVTDAFTLNLKGGVGAGAITSQTTAAVTDAEADWTAVTINSTGGTATSSVNANVVGALDLAGGNTMQTLTINADSSLTTGAIAGWDTTGSGTANKGAIIVTGGAQVDLDGSALDAAVESVDASGSSGGVRVQASTQTDFQFVGSTGDDRFTTNAVLSTTTGSAGSVDAGEGTDRLIVGTSAHITTTVGALYTNFEVLQVENGVSVDMDHLSGITNIRINDGAGTTGVTDMSAAQAANVTLVAGGANAVTLGVKNAGDIGQQDSITLTIDDGASAAADIALTAPVMTGVETLTINAAADAVSISALTSATSLTSIVVNATHASSVTTDITTGAVAFGANTHIDGSGSTAPLLINTDGQTAAGNGVRISGGDGADTLTASGVNADLVQGNGGIDTIDITADAATAEIVTVRSEVTTTASADSITGFETAEDQFDYNGTLSNGTGGGSVAAAEVASSTTIALALATAGAANDTVFIATTDLAAGDETALDAFVAAPSASLATATVDAFLATGGALNGTIANLDSVVGAGDSVLFQFSTDTDTVVFLITNTDTSTADTLTSAEVNLVGAFVAATDLVAADYA